MITTAFVIGFIILSLSSLAIYAKGSNAPSVRHHTYLHSAVPFIAATAYLAMALGVGDIVTPDGVVTFTARYVDWSITTPILLAGLVLTAMHERGRFGEVGGYMIAIIVLDVLMIIAGLISALSPSGLGKLIWYLWSCVAFLGVLYILWVPLMKHSVDQGGGIDTAYKKNVTFLSVIWFLYPIVFGIGPEGLKIVDTAAVVWAILVLDIVAKVVYAFYAAGNLDKAIPVDDHHTYVPVRR